MSDFAPARRLRRAAASLVWLAVAVAVWALVPLPAQAQFATALPRAIVVDADTGAALFDKGADERFAPGSLAKLMTAAVVFDGIAAGRIGPDDQFTVSEHAWTVGGPTAGGSTMFATLGSQIAVSDLLRGIMVQSANDAAIVLAEGVAGSEADFVALMNDKARALGLTGSHFTDAAGLLDDDQYVTARDLAVLARHIVRDFPQFYPIYRERKFSWNEISQNNRNLLLDASIGADGLKTGFVEAAGYGVVASAMRQGRRVIVVASGAKDERQRYEEAYTLCVTGLDTIAGTPVARAAEPRPVPERAVPGAQAQVAPAPAAPAAMASLDPAPAPAEVRPVVIGERRIALIIANASYQNKPPLTNPPRDAEAVEAALRTVGFADVRVVLDADRTTMLRALNEFADAAAGADWAMIYYAGHGLEMGGVNYLIPVDAGLASDREVPDEGVPLDKLMATVEPARKLRLVILDACRSNPFLASMRVTSATRDIGDRGLLAIEPMGGTLVEYAAKAGQLAKDGDSGGNSPFAAALVQRLLTPGLEIGMLFRQVRDDVLRATDGAQEPFTYGSLPGEVMFFHPGQVAAR